MFLWAFTRIHLRGTNITGIGSHTLVRQPAVVHNTGSGSGGTGPRPGGGGAGATRMSFCCSGWLPSSCGREAHLTGGAGQGARVGGAGVPGPDLGLQVREIVHGCVPGVGRRHGAHDLVRARGGRRPHPRSGWR
jgi:hypothetical protein